MSIEINLTARNTETGYEKTWPIDLLMQMQDNTVARILMDKLCWLIESDTNLSMQDWELSEDGLTISHVSQDIVMQCKDEHSARMTWAQLTGYPGPGHPLLKKRDHHRPQVKPIPSIG